MKKNTKTLVFLLSVFGFLMCTHAQDSFQQIQGGEFNFNETKNPCLTFEQRENIKTVTQKNIQLLKQENKLAFSELNRAGGHVLFNWPIQQATGFNFNDTWGISGYVDHNSNYPNALLDYNCEPRTYDTSSGYNHQGVDIYLWPFSWKQMDDNQTEIIAAAAGQIIAKGDGQFDRSCGFNNNSWNAVYIQHSDGSIAWYGHMKNGSVTTKNVGDMVTAGEILGVVGSSGNSTGPHLHFEVYLNSSYTQLIDPYYGACNGLNADSWWQNQKPHINTNINAVLTHSAPPIFPTCPDAEITNENDAFDSADTIYFAIYLRDQISGTNVNLKIIRPDNTYLYNWNFTLADTYYSSYWYWAYSNVYDMDGVWKWEATYNGQTVTHSFTIGTLSVDDNTLNAISVYPNPTKNYVNISSNQAITKVRLADIQGKIIKTINAEEIKKVSLENLSIGMYFLTLESEANKQKTIKIIKE